MRPTPRRLALLALTAFAGPVPLAAAPAVSSGLDAKAAALAESVLDAMGGRDAWERTRFLSWRLGKRLHHWDRWTGDVRIESGERLVLMNLESRKGRVFEAGAEVADPAALETALQHGYACWVNDSYWLIMPYKLLDPGVRLRYDGSAALADGRPAQRLTLTFDEGVGLTPENRYEVWVADDTGLVEQWAFYATADGTAPSFTLPWSGWQRFGGILLATDHGEDADWEIAAPESLPRSLFEAP